MNLVLNDSEKNISTTESSFNFLEQIYIFFGHSVKRWKIWYEMGNTKTTLNQWCPTSWSSKMICSLAIKHKYVDIIKALSKILIIKNESSEDFEVNEGYYY